MKSKTCRIAPIGAASFFFIFKKKDIADSGTSRVVMQVGCAPKNKIITNYCCYSKGIYCTIAGIKKVAKMKLKQPDDKFIKVTYEDYTKIEGDELNEKLQKLFVVFNDDKNKYDVLIKVAALNKIYSTAITNINPVVDQITKAASENGKLENIGDFINYVDKISKIEWTNEKEENFKRNNLSFASKYVHFLSNREIPIYDSYIWIVIKGYLGQKKQEKISFANPTNYLEFYDTFCEFKSLYSLDKYSNYHIDKFLWFYGRTLIKDIEKQLNIDLDKAKSELKKRLKESL